VRQSSRAFDLASDPDATNAGYSAGLFELVDESMIPFRTGL
jgi:hypothetical protein